ncbi:MAG TPA: glycosyltransferase family 4 protein [Candidatus Saccharimonadales bacterium]|nr:glycosyltransferase family 4 protein [Candidatus Saccharimonadales bacterium]
MSRPPRVVILVENLPVPLDRRAWQEALALARDGWAVTVIGPRGGPGMRAWRERSEGVEIRRYPQRAASGLSGYLVEYLPSMVCTGAWLIAERLRGRIDVVHACNPPDLLWVFGRMGRHFVFDQHDVGPELAATKWGTGGGPKARILGGLTRWLERRSYRAASLVIAPNDSYRAIAMDRGRVSPDDVVVVRNAPDLARYRELAAGVAPVPRRVGYVGVMGSQDGLERLIDAWRSVVDAPDMADAHLELVGDGEARPALESQVDRLGLRDAVTFHGYQRPDVFVPLLAACTVCVSPDPPTLFNDVSTMVKVVDYLAIGRGIVSYRLLETGTIAGDAAHFAADESTQALAAAILEVLRDPLLAARLGSAGAARVDAVGLDWERSAARLTSAYRGLIAG